jgi:hypothetical protein
MKEETMPHDQQKPCLAGTVPPPLSADTCPAGRGGAGGGTAATGPAILAELYQIKEQISTIQEQLARHIAADEQRMRLVDQFIDPALDLEGTLKQVLSFSRHNGYAVRDLEKAAHDLERTARQAVELALSDPRHAPKGREANGPE